MIDIRAFFRKKSKRLTFTYYVPAPPSRNTPYQERHFDSLIKSLSEEGHQIVDVKMQSVQSEKNSGTLVIVVYEALLNSKEFSMSKFDDDFPHDNTEKPEGLYYLD